MNDLRNNTGRIPLNRKLSDHHATSKMHLGLRIVHTDTNLAAHSFTSARYGMSLARISRIGFNFLSDFQTPYMTIM